ncbi:MAG: helix-turn-helix domain-containing protein [Chloroflexota bacterium]
MALRLVRIVAAAAILAMGCMVHDPSRASADETSPSPDQMALLADTVEADGDDPADAPESTEPAVEPSPQPSPTEVPSAAASDEPEPTEVPQPEASAEPAPSEVPMPGATAEPAPTDTPQPETSAEPAPTEAPLPEVTADPAASAEPATSAEPSASAEPAPQSSIEPVPVAAEPDAADEAVAPVVVPERAVASPPGPTAPSALGATPGYVSSTSRTGGTVQAVADLQAVASTPSSPSSVESVQAVATVTEAAPTAAEADRSAVVPSRWTSVDDHDLVRALSVAVLEGAEPVSAGVVAGIAATNRAPTVAVAMEFGRAGSGWAGAIVFNLWLRRQMRERRMSQRQLAALSGVNHSTISRLIRQDRHPSLETATKLAKALRKAGGELDTADYFERLPEETLFPARRVELALRGDELLDDEDVDRLMRSYLRARENRRSVPARVVIDGPSSSDAEAPR